MGSPAAVSPRTRKRSEFVHQDRHLRARADGEIDSVSLVSIEIGGNHRGRFLAELLTDHFVASVATSVEDGDEPASIHHDQIGDAVVVEVEKAAILRVERVGHVA